MPVDEISQNVTVLFSAYACDPTQGSESGAGWSLLQAAAELAGSITVLTRTGNAPMLESEAAKLPCPIRIIRISTPFDGSKSTYRRYIAWIFAASLVARRESKGSHIFHHATFASDWMFPPVVLGIAPKVKFVWGPAGGNTYPPLALLRGLAPKFAAKETLRWFATKTCRSLVRFFLRRKVDVFIALNEDSGRSAPPGADLLYHSNCVLPYENYEVQSPRSDRKVALYLGRLIDLKGLFLVKAAFEQLEDDWRLVLIGDGPLRAGLEKWASQFGDRVTVLGQISHSDIRHHLAQASVLLFPGLHDTAPWASAEAAAAGLPVVCLDLGGVAQMAGDNAVVVEVEPIRNLNFRLARAVESTSGKNFMPQRNWTKESMTSVLKTAYS